MTHIFGEIDCPHCGKKMKVKADKNGDPFGHCEHCSGQLRVGGKESRINDFFALYNHLERGASKDLAIPPPQDKKPEKPPLIAKPAAPAAPPKKIGFSFFDQLEAIAK